MTHLIKRLLWWLLCTTIFFTVFAFALNNRESVVVHWFFGYHTRIQLVLLVLAVFVLGMLAGSLAMLPRWWRMYQRAEGRLPAAAETDPVQKKTNTHAAKAGKQEELIDAV